MGFDNKIQLKDMFEKPEYSDLTIRLNGGKELHVHKFTVCARNDYFLKLCGPDSHFAVSFIERRTRKANLTHFFRKASSAPSSSRTTTKLPSCMFSVISTDLRSLRLVHGCSG